MVDIVYKKTGAIFNQHTYWTKQPIESIIYFIDKLTKKNDTILDPFCGSGMTGIGATLTGRKSILKDISPACIHISKGYNTKIDIDSKKLDHFIKNIEKKLTKYNETSCEYCNEKAKIKYEIIGENYTTEEGEIISFSRKIFDSIRDNITLNKSNININKHKFLNHYVLSICYTCKCSKEKHYKVPNYKDLIDYKKINNKDLFPTNLFFGKECKRNFKKNISKVCDLYSKKNLLSLNIIREEILLVDDIDLRNFLLFNFTSILFNTSLMSRYRRYENTSIKMGTYYVPQLIKDNNVLSSFKRKVRSTYKANKKIFENTKISNVQISVGDATNLNDIKDNSIDLIYTDPPYGDIINYSELNLVWESWLDVSNNYKNEMIVCETENKSIVNYFELFEKFLNEASRVLKKNKQLILIFHHPNIKFWAKLQDILFKSNFILDLQPTPTRLISINKTSSQHKTKKITQTFIAIQLINSKKRNNFNLCELDKKTYETIRSEGNTLNYVSDSDFYDYFINFSLNKYSLKNSLGVIF